MSDSAQLLVEKAGGVIIRENEGKPEVYIVHRPRHDDWSLPKGHIDSGETPVQAALREVTEEVGFHCTVERELPPYIYTMPDGNQSIVHFFEMKVVDEDISETDGEVDEGRWVSVAQAVALISYHSLADYITAVAAN